MSVLRTADDFHDLAWAYLLRAKEQGVAHVEMFFDPQAHTSRGVPFEEVIGGYDRAARRAREELDISAELILCFLRDLPAEDAMATLEAALPHRDSSSGSASTPTSAVTRGKVRGGLRPGPRGGACC